MKKKKRLLICLGILNFIGYIGSLISLPIEGFTGLVTSVFFASLYGATLSEILLESK